MVYVIVGVLLTSGVALAATVNCPNASNGKCAGTRGDDRLLGTANVDRISAGQGDDTAFGGQADDSLNGQQDDDKLYGEEGDDFIRGDFTFGPGLDLLVGGEGNDELAGGQSADRLRGGPGRDVIFGFYGTCDEEPCPDDDADTLWGGDARDTLQGDNANDTLYGEEGDDRMFGGFGDDLLRGGPGADGLVPEPAGSQQTSVDELNGGTGEDTFYSPQNASDLSIVVQAVDGEPDVIYCNAENDETVRADAVDTFPAPREGVGIQNCDDLTVVP